MQRLDHIVIACENLAEGGDWLTQKLGRRPDPGGQHPMFGTHNLLLSLGPTEYLELIAIDPFAPAPDRPRWYGLDSFSGDPRVVAWVAQGETFTAPAGSTMTKLSRGNLTWLMTLPDGGAMPGHGTQPLGIRWLTGGHPCAQLLDDGFRLDALRMTHPEPAPLPFPDPRLSLAFGPTRLDAAIRAPDGNIIWL